MVRRRRATQRRRRSPKLTSPVAHETRWTTRSRYLKRRGCAPPEVRAGPPTGVVHFWARYPQSLRWLGARLGLMSGLSFSGPPLASGVAPYTRPVWRLPGKRPICTSLGIAATGTGTAQVTRLLPGRHKRLTRRQPMAADGWPPTMDDSSIFATGHPAALASPLPRRALRRPSPPRREHRRRALRCHPSRSSRTASPRSPST
jgi:hypothetical protein